jgi:hypothetical protein
MVPKPNKDISSPTGYRPISLLSCISKCFERIIGERLYDQLESLNFFNKIQTGFRKKRSTQEHLLRLAQKVHNAFKKRNCTVGVFLDVSSAFDAVWLDGLKFKINKIKIPANLKKLLFSFLDDRSLHVNVNGCPSLRINLEAGTPQGSCISPLLYCIFVNDLPCQSFRETAACQFAYDIGIWSTKLKQTYNFRFTKLKSGVPLGGSLSTMPKAKSSFSRDALATAFYNQACSSLETN